MGQGVSPCRGFAGLRWSSPPSRSSSHSSPLRSPRPRRGPPGSGSGQPLRSSSWSATRESPLLSSPWGFHWWLETRRSSSACAASRTTIRSVSGRRSTARVPCTSASFPPTSSKGGSVSIASSASSCSTARVAFASGAESPMPASPDGRRSASTTPAPSIRPTPRGAAATRSPSDRCGGSIRAGRWRRCSPTPRFVFPTAGTRRWSRSSLGTRSCSGSRPRTPRFV